MKYPLQTPVTFTHSRIQRLGRIVSVYSCIHTRITYYAVQCGRGFTVALHGGEFRAAK